MNVTVGWLEEQDKSSDIEQQWRYIRSRKPDICRYQSVTVVVLFIVPFEYPTYQSVHMVHLKLRWAIKNIPFPC